jgi:hypothetical protein
MRPWDRSYEKVSVLVDAFFQNDPYYPRPRDGGPIYRKFREGYLLAYPPTDMCRSICRSFFNRDRNKGWSSAMIGAVSLLGAVPIFLVNLLSLG